MSILSMIVATADNNIIGKNNTIAWHLLTDLAYFKKVTLGKPIIMGRKTFASIGRALPEFKWDTYHEDTIAAHESDDDYDVEVEYRQ